MILTRAQLDELVAQARADAPYETCGMLGGREGRAFQIYPIPNIAPNRIKNYYMDGAAQIAAMQDMDARGYDILAIYHSHPASPPYPSPTDVRDAFDPDLGEPRYPGTVYLLISLMDPDAPIVRAFRLDGPTVTELELELVESPHEQT